MIAAISTGDGFHILLACLFVTSILLAIHRLTRAVEHSNKPSVRDASGDCEYPGCERPRVRKGLDPQMRVKWYCDLHALPVKRGYQ